MSAAIRRLFALGLVASLATLPAAAGTRTGAEQTPADALRQLRRAAGGHVVAHRSSATGAFDFVRATGGAVLWRSSPAAGAPARAYAFLAARGAVVGMNAAERALAARRSESEPAPAELRGASELRVKRVETGPGGASHVRLDQFYRGLPVFGAEVVVHVNRLGTTAVNGAFVPSVSVAVSPAVPAADAGRIALRSVSKTIPGIPLEVASSTIQVYRTGLLERYVGRSVLAWAVEVAGKGVREQVWVDATLGAVFNRISLNHEALDRCVYSPTFDPDNPDLFVVRREGDPPTHVPPFDNLYDFSGMVYDLFSKAFGRDSYDGLGHKMRTVYLVNDACPNAYWDGQATNYCPGFDVDDVVAHEWGHAYTEYTHGLIYQWQPGALNESYSDIWGEIVDLTNNWDGLAGGDNTQPYPNGVRWVVGEDLTEPVGDALKLRDMWNPERRGLPAKVSSAFYVCGTGDGGGVHSNSSVPNHAFAMLVDGKTFNGHTVTGIGMDKAARIYYDAMVNYQTPTTTFPEHAQALQAACGNLVGVNVNGLTTGLPISSPIAAGDCTQVGEAIAAVEMGNEPVQCGFKPLLAPGAPPACGGGTVVFAEDWEAGLTGWTPNSAGTVPADWPGYNWAAVGSLPGGRAGQAAFAINENTGSCASGSGENVAGKFSIDSPAITIPSITFASGDPSFKLRFDHWVETEAGFDGGNLKISVNAGPWQLVPQASYGFNAPNATLAAGNPNSGQRAWSGTDGGKLTGSWGTTIADLTSLVDAGDSVVLRLEFGQDCQDGRTGWYVDDLSLTACPPVPAPSLSLGGDYGNPDNDGSYTLSWTLPTGATGPNVLQEATVTAPFVNEDAEAGLGNWQLSTTSPAMLNWEVSDSKPMHSGKAFFARGHDAQFFVLEGAAIMQYGSAISVPALGDTVLTFRDWFMAEPDDGGFVDVSTNNGASWQSVYSIARGTAVQNEIVPFATEPLSPRTVNLTAFAGQTIRLRFRYLAAFTNYVNVIPIGWYVDDIKIANVTFQPLATTAGTSYLVSGKADGSYLYRVRTTYTFGSEVVPGEWSNVVTASVASP
jgi:Zn-dependent metalloprotease